MHHGIKGQKWGIRRYQNSDGSLTIEGRKRYSTGDFKKKVSELRAKHKEKTAARLKRFRERQKEAAKVRDQKLKDLELENLVLREKLKAMWGDENHDTDNNGSGNV